MSTLRSRLNYKITGKIMNATGIHNKRFGSFVNRGINYTEKRMLRKTGWSLGSEFLSNIKSKIF